MDKVKAFLEQLKSQISTFNNFISKIFTFTKNIFKKFITLPTLLLKVGAVLIIVLILSVTVFKKLPNVLGWISLHNPFVTKSEYQETTKDWQTKLKLVDKVQKQIQDSLIFEVKKRDTLIVKLDKKKTDLKTTVINNQKEIQDAKGDIKLLDSIGNTIY